MATAVDPTKIRHSSTASKSDETERVLALADTPEARREKAKLAAAYRILAQRGLDDGVAGHISLRVPGAPDYFWVNPFGLFFEEVTADNLVLVNHDGAIVSNNWGMINYAGFCIHSAIHKARPDVNCACHTHPPQGSSYSALALPLDPLDQTGCSFYEDQAVYKEYDGIVLSGGQADGIVNCLGDKRALILVNHGLLTCGSSVEQALVDMIDMERTCGVNLRAMASGHPLTLVPPEAAVQARAVLTQQARYPFIWAALIRQLNRHGTDYDPHNWS